MHAVESLLRRHHSVGGDIDTERRGRNRPPLLLKKGRRIKREKAEREYRGVSPTTLSEKALVTESYLLD